MVLVSLLELPVPTVKSASHLEDKIYSRTLLAFLNLPRIKHRFSPAPGHLSVERNEGIYPQGLSEDSGLFLTPLLSLRLTCLLLA